MPINKNLDDFHKVVKLLLGDSLKRAAERANNEVSEFTNTQLATFGAMVAGVCHPRSEL